MFTHSFPFLLFGFLGFVRRQNLIFRFLQSVSLCFWLLGLLWFGFTLMGLGAFVLIFPLFYVWLEIGTESSHSDLAFWAERPEDRGPNHCKFMSKFVNLVIFYLLLLNFSRVCTFNFYTFKLLIKIFFFLEFVDFEFFLLLVLLFS